MIDSFSPPVLSYELAREAAPVLGPLGDNTLRHIPHPLLLLANTQPRLLCSLLRSARHLK
jgi:hypothetical protein